MTTKTKWINLPTLQKLIWSSLNDEVRPMWVHHLHLDMIARVSE